MLNKYDNINGLQARDIMTSNPKTIEVDVLAVKALRTIQKHDISQLLAVDGSEYKGVVHIHNLINEGIL
jgi:arabinose-5-phosphate isomerase